MSGLVLPSRWLTVPIREILSPLRHGRTVEQGWSPQCDAEPAAPDEWGILKTTAIQAGQFVDAHNKRLPASLSPRPDIEVAAGDIVITCAGPRSRCGVPALVRRTRRRLMLSGKMYRCRVPGGLVDPAFVEAWLLSAVAQADIDRMKTGGSDSGLNLTHQRFQELEIRLAPFAEQKRIVEALDSYLSRLDAAAASLERAQAKLKAYRTSVLKPAVEGRLVPTEAELARQEGRDYEPASVLLDRILVQRRRRWEEAELARLTKAGKPPKDEKWKAKYEEPAKPDLSGLRELPEGWCWTTLTQIAGVQLGQQRSPDHAGADVQLPYVRAANITWEGIDVRDLKTMGFPNPERYALRYGDVLLSEASGSPMEAGKPAIWRGEVPAACFQKTVLRIRAFDARGLLSEYLRLVFLDSCRSGAFARAAPGVGIVHLTAERMLLWPIPLPPVADQSRIVDESERLESVAKKARSDTERSRLAISKLRQSILKWAFEGRLVDPDPNDEPAEQLLARIRGERAAARAAPKKSRARAPRAKP